MRRSIVGLVIVISIVLTDGMAWGSAFEPGLYATKIDPWNATTGNGVIRVDSNGSSSTVLSFSGTDCPYGLAFYDANRLGVTFGGGPSVNAWGTFKILGSQGDVLSFIDHIPATNVWSNHSWGSGFAIDTDGTAYVSTHNSPGATKITATGQVSDWTGYKYDLWWGKDAAIAPDRKLYMTHGLEQSDAHNFTIDEIDMTTGVVATVLDNLDWTVGIAFNAAGDMYFSQERLNQVWKLSTGSTEPTLLASIPYAGRMTMGPDNYLYAIGKQSDTRYQIWRVDTNVGIAMLYADNLPPLTDIAYLSVPEPSTLALLGIGAMGLLAYAWRRRTT